MSTRTNGATSGRAERRRRRRVSEVICVDLKTQRSARGERVSSGARNRRTGVCASARHTATDATGTAVERGSRRNSDR